MGEANNKEKERQKVAKEEQNLIEQLEKQALDKIEKAKKEQEIELAGWQKQKLIRESEAKRKEQQEMDNRLAEELRWAEEIKIQTQKEKEKIEQEIKKAEDVKKEEERQMKAKAEKEMLERLEEEAKEKLRIQKEEEEKRIKEEQEAWEKMPKWKKEKVLRERKGSLTSDSSRKNSLVDTPEKNSPIGTPLRKDSLKNGQCDSPNMNGQSPKLNVIVNGEQTDNPTRIKKDLDPKMDTPEDIQNDKFSEWLEKELKQTNQDPSDILDTIKEELKSPAPVRRRRNPTGEETKDTVVPVTRPTRKSRVGDTFNHEKSPSLSAESPVPNTAPVASTRSKRSKPDLPSPASTETGDGVRSVGVGVQTRPGYKDATTQTDRVATRDMAV